MMFFFAMSHGVNRGDLKSGKIDERESIINKLIKLNKNLKFDELASLNNLIAASTFPIDLILF